MLTPRSFRLDAEYIKALVKKAAEFGNGKIHIIVNNAGSVLLPIPHCLYLQACLQIYLGRCNPQGRSNPMIHRSAVYSRLRNIRADVRIKLRNLLIWCHK